MEVLTDRPEERFVRGAVLHPEGQGERLTIARSQPVADGPGWWLTFTERTTREAAHSLRDQYLEIVEPAGTRPEGTFFWHEILGLAVRGTDGRELGTVREVYRAGEAEVFVVEGPRGEIDVPAVRGIVVSLDPGAGEIVVDTDALALDDRPIESDPPRERPRSPRRRTSHGKARAARAAREGEQTGDRD